MSNNRYDLITRINKARELADGFFDSLIVEEGAKYTSAHDYLKYPAALLYGSWSVVLGKTLLNGKNWDNKQKEFLKNSMLKYRQNDGTFIPQVLLNEKPSKSFEYLTLHTTNYTIGAMMELDSDFDFRSSYYDSFLDANYLERWLSGRNFCRPWEESNNIVNVASYLALCNDRGIHGGEDRLRQMLDWHNKYQNNKTGGFDNFSRNRKNILQSMAGAVHNFHIHLYLKEPLNYEKIIAKNIIPYFFEGPLTGCLSIDFIELACRTVTFLDGNERDELVCAMLYHLDTLLKYQNSDGGWFEGDNRNSKTSAAGMKDEVPSSCSYATWFRLCSIGMIAITLLGDNEQRWHFRKTLGMGYAPNYWNRIDLGNYNIDSNIVRKFKNKNRPHVLKKQLINFAIRIIK